MFVTVDVLGGVEELVRSVTSGADVTWSTSEVVEVADVDDSVDDVLVEDDVLVVEVGVSEDVVLELVVL